MVGDSAGGNLATVLCLMARDKGVQFLCAQVHIYPWVDRNMECGSMKKFTVLYSSTKDYEHMEYFSPVGAPSLAGLSSAYVETAEFDCLLDSGLLYAQLLKESGIEVELHETIATMHGYDIAVNSNLVKNLMDKRVAFLKKVLFPQIILNTIKQSRQGESGLA